MKTKKRKLKIERYRHRMPYNSFATDFYVDRTGGNDETGDGSMERPVRTAKGLRALWKRLEENKRAEFEEKHRAERQAAEEADRKRREEQEADRKKREEERLAKEKVQDEKLAQLQVELVSLEKTYLETVHLFELAQIDLISPGVRSEAIRGSTGEERERAVNLAQQLHHLRMVGAARLHEFEALYAQVKHERSSSSLWGAPWLGYLLMGSVALYAYSLFRKSIPGVKPK